MKKFTLFKSLGPNVVWGLENVVVGGKYGELSHCGVFFIFHPVTNELFKKSDIHCPVIRVNSYGPSTCGSKHGHYINISSLMNKY